MKKYLRLSAATLLLIIATTFIPKVADNMVTSVELMYPSKSAASDDIYVSGAVEEISKRDIFVEIPIVPDEVKVEIGDYVDVHDVIATVDTSATQVALFNLAESVNVIPQEYMQVLGSMNLSEDLVKDYIPTEIVSPTSGVVTQLDMIGGCVAYPKSTVCTISKTNRTRAKMTVEELDADKIELKDTVVFKASATGDVKYTGTVERIFPSATQTISGTSQVTVVGFYVDFDEKYSRLKPGYSLNGVVKKLSDKVVNSIPYEAILQDKDNQEYIYVYDNGHAVRKNVTTGEEFSDTVEITSGINSEDLIIKNAKDIKKENAMVKTVE